jgi:hypothetical protein
MQDIISECCVLENPVFTALGSAVFRRAEADGVPVMALSLGDKLAVLPLRALQREFHIDGASRDGRMLGLIAESLDYVAGLHIGDQLPPEVLTGAPSWTPDPKHLRIAGTRLRLRLLAWLHPDEAEITPERLESDPKLRATVQAAFEQAAQALEVAGPAAVVKLVETLAEELSFIECLRETLLERVQSIHAQILALGHNWRGNAAREERLTQVRRLAAKAAHQLADRFAQIDAHTGEIIGALRNLDGQCAFICGHRNWLYRSRRAWEPVLQDWQGASTALDSANWLRLARTHQFLAPRFMSVHEWEQHAATPSPRRQSAVMKW